MKKNRSNLKAGFVQPIGKFGETKSMSQKTNQLNLMSKFKFQQNSMNSQQFSEADNTGQRSSSQQRQEQFNFQRGSSSQRTLFLAETQNTDSSQRQCHTTRHIEVSSQRQMFSQKQAFEGQGIKELRSAQMLQIQNVSEPSIQKMAGVSSFNGQFVKPLKSQRQPSQQPPSPAMKAIAQNTRNHNIDDLITDQTDGTGGSISAEQPVQRQNSKGQKRGRVQQRSQNRKENLDKSMDSMDMDENIEIVQYGRQQNNLSREQNTINQMEIILWNQNVDVDSKVQILIQKIRELATEEIIGQMELMIQDHQLNSDSKMHLLVEKIRELAYKVQYNKHILQKKTTSELSSNLSLNGFMLTLGENGCPQCSQCTHGIHSFRNPALTDWTLDKDQFDERNTFSTSAVQQTQLMQITKENKKFTKKRMEVKGQVSYNSKEITDLGIPNEYSEQMIKQHSLKQLHYQQNIETHESSQPNQKAQQTPDSVTEYSYQSIRVEEVKEEMNQSGALRKVKQKPQTMTQYKNRVQSKSGVINQHMQSVAIIQTQQEPVKSQPPQMIQAVQVKAAPPNPGPPSARDHQTLKSSNQVVISSNTSQGSPMSPRQRSQQRLQVLTNQSSTRVSTLKPVALGDNKVVEQTSQASPFTIRDVGEPPKVVQIQQKFVKGIQQKMSEQLKSDQRPIVKSKTSVNDPGETGASANVSPKVRTDNSEIDVETITLNEDEQLRQYKEKILVDYNQESLVTGSKDGGSLLGSILKGSIITEENKTPKVVSPVKKERKFMNYLSKPEGLSPKKADHIQEPQKQQKELQVKSKSGNPNRIQQNLKQRQLLCIEINILIKVLQSDFDKYTIALDNTPEESDQLFQTLCQMQISAEPDESADYWQEREIILQRLKAITKTKEMFEGLMTEHSKRKSNFDYVKTILEKTQEVHDLEKYAKQMKQGSVDLREQIGNVQECRSVFIEIKKNIHNCQIPVHIQRRRNELKAYMEKLEKVKVAFYELKQAEQDFDGEAGSQNDVRDLILKIEVLIAERAQEGKTMQLHQTSKLDRYREQDFLAYTVYVIIIEVREFKIVIYQAMQKFQDLEDLIDQLSQRLITQDMEHTLMILSKQAIKLRERLLAAQMGLQKISNAGEEMDGNTTLSEEDDLIETLKQKMPNIFINIDLVFEQINGIDVLLKQVSQSRNIQKMAQLKKEIVDVTQKVEQNEDLSIKLENEIVEWNAFKKLCRRDEELAEIDGITQQYSTDLLEVLEELQQINQQLQNYNNSKTEKQRTILLNYMDQIEELMTLIIKIKDEKDQCFKEFDIDLPKMVREARAKRLQISTELGCPSIRKPGSSKVNITGINASQITESDKPVDVYYMITINCRYKKRIHWLLKELKNLSQRKKELEGQYSSLKIEVTPDTTPVKKSIVKTPEKLEVAVAVKQVKKIPESPKVEVKEVQEVQEVIKEEPVKQVYKATKGDQIDEMMAMYMNKLGCTLTLKRIHEGKYLFGTKTIQAKIINGKLVIRVGGGYMSAEEFIKQYGEIEMQKLLNNQAKLLKKQQEAGASVIRIEGARGQMQKKSNSNMDIQVETRVVNGVNPYAKPMNHLDLIGSPASKTSAKKLQKVTSMEDIQVSVKTQRLPKISVSPTNRRFQSPDMGSLGSTKRHNFQARK